MIEQAASEGKGPGRASSPVSVRARAVTVVVLASLAIVTAAVAAYALAEGRVGLYREGSEIVTVQDFASHNRFARAAWSGAFGRADSSLYTVDAHLRFMSAWAGEPTERALPFGYSPTMLWVLAPTAAVPLWLAYVLWTLAGFGAAVWTVLHPRMNRLAGVAVLLTPVAAASVALGQTAVLTLAALFVLMERSLRRASEGEPRGRSWLAMAVVLWALTAKPPLALTAGAALLALRWSRTVWAAIGFTVVSTVALLPWIGVAWPTDYQEMLSTYDLSRADAAFAWSLVPSIMTNLRATLLLEVGLPDAEASAIANLLWASSLVAIVWAGRTRRLTPGGVWALAVLSFLLLCSHVSFTEDLLLLLVPAAVVAGGSSRPVRWAAAAWASVPVGLVLNAALGPLAGVRPPLLFFLKILLLLWVLRATAGRRVGQGEAGDLLGAGSVASLR